MKANELRIGNYTKEGIVKCIIDDRIVIDTTDIHITNINPIPLTEEILLKGGFWVSSNIHGIKRYSHEYLDVDVEKQGKKFAFCIWCEENPATTIFIMHSEFLHTFQNNFFALTNKELEITI